MAVVVRIGVVAVVGASIAIFRLIDLLDGVPLGLILLALMLCLWLMVKRRFLFRHCPGREGVSLFYLGNAVDLSPTEGNLGGRPGDRAG